MNQTTSETEFVHSNTTNTDPMEPQTQSTLMEKLRTDVDELRDDMSEIGGNIKDIKFALLGSAFTGGKGLILEVTTIETRVKTLEKMFDKYKNILVGLSLGAGVGIGTIIKAVVDIFTKH